MWRDGELLYEDLETETVLQHNDVTRGGLTKLGIYYWRWKEIAEVRNSLELGITNRELYFDELRLFSGQDGFEVVRPGL